MMPSYSHQLPEWPNFTWDNQALIELLAAVRHRQGRFIGRMEALGFKLRSEAVLQTLSQDVIKTSEIEGENLDAEQVRSSIARRLGMDMGGVMAADRDVEGIVEMMLDATQNYAQPLDESRLFDWHAALFPTGRSGMSRIIIGAWRDDRHGPMQVTSGPIGRECVHYEAPRAARLEAEMRKFLEWFENDATLDRVLKAAIAHLWFVSIHPFEDGNGRIARAIADLMLARSEGSAQRFYSMSAQIRAERNDYYGILESMQKGELDITVWLSWFLGCLDRAFDRAEETLAGVLRRARFWDHHADKMFNERQRKMLVRLMDDFFGKLTTSKWAKMQKCSTDTALRDITNLLGLGILEKDPGGGRSTSYSLVFPDGDHRLGI